MSQDDLKETHQQDGEAFRDSLAIVTDEGKRKWIYPKKPEGRFTTARTLVSWVLLVVLFGVPFITVDGHPFMLLNSVDRKFILSAARSGRTTFICSASR